MLSYFYAPLKIKKSKEGSRTLIETPPTVIGEGTYGCVHRPSLRCENKPKKLDYKGKISKIGKKKNINEEIAEYKTINRVDKRAIFYPGKPDNCQPMRDKPTLDAIDKCSDFNSKDIAKYKLLIMKDGGENLADFAKSINSQLLSNKINIETARDQMEKFWIEAHRMFLGLSKFLDAGIVHHDLKHKNIVYNVDTNRINFIDFGLMTTVNKIRTESKESNYGFSIRHWSFPPETLFLNHERYLQFATTDNTIKISKKSKTSEKTARQKVFASFLNELKDPNSDINTFFAITDPEFPEKKQNSFNVQEHMNEYYRMVMTSLKENMYDEFLDKSVSTIDSYGLAIGLIYVLNLTRHLLDEKFADDLYNLFFNMMNFNVIERLSLEDAMIRYEDILQNNRILLKYNKHFENHQLTENGPAIQNAQRILKTIQIPDINISEAKLESNPETRCPRGTNFNKKKKRCIDSIRSKSRSKSKKSMNKTKKIKISKNISSNYSINL